MNAPKKIVASELSESALGLAVAKIMHPDYEWHAEQDMAAGVNDSMVGGKWMFFFYNSRESLGDMCVWYASHINPLHERLCIKLRGKKPNRAVAEAIVEFANG